MFYLGLILFFVLHLGTILRRGERARVIGTIGEKPYKGIFALLVLGSLALIVMGWSDANMTMLYEPPSWAFHVTPLVVLFGFVLFFAARAPTNIKRFIRHPQLTGVTLWGIGHLLANGEERSVALFAGFAAWALLSMAAINKRDGEWVKPPKQAAIKDVLTVAVGLVLYGLFFHFHAQIIGVDPLGF